MLAETIISFMLLALLMSMIAVLMRGAMLMTTNSVQNAKISQEDEINPALMEDYNGSIVIPFRITGTINLPASVSGEIPAITIALNPEHQVRFNTFCALFPACTDDCNDEIAFSPEVP